MIGFNLKMSKCEGIERHDCSYTRTRDFRSFSAFKKEGYNYSNAYELFLPTRRNEGKRSVPRRELHAVAVKCYLTQALF